MSKQTFEQRLNDELKQLPVEKTPERDLWVGIEQAISKTPTNASNRFRAAYGLAASLMVVSLVAWFSFQSGKTIQGNELVAAMSAQHQQQKQALLVQYENQTSATKNWQEQIAELDEAANAIKKALEEEPNNPALLKMLKHVYEQQMSLIERVHAPSWNQI
jgi:ribosomal protein S15P/S13E